MNEILEALKDLSKLSETLGSLEADKQAEFETGLNEFVDNTIKTKYLDEYVSALLNGTDTTVEATNADLFRETQDWAVNHYGELNETALKVAISSYIEKGGEFSGITLPDVKLTYGEVYGLKSEDELASQESQLSTATREGLDESIFCGANKTFPIQNKAEAIAALKMLSRYEGDDKDDVKKKVKNKAKKYGVGSSSTNNKESLVLHPILVETSDEDYTLLTVENLQQLEAIKTGLDSIKDSYELTDEQFTQITQFLTEAEAILADDAPLLPNDGCEAGPVTLPTDFFVRAFVKRESNPDLRKYLVPLVGLIRQNKLTKEAVESATKYYQVFGTAVLENWLSNVPEKATTDESEDAKNIVAESEEKPSITVIPSPSAAAEDTQEGEPNESNVGFDIYKDFFGKSGRRGK